MKIIRTIAVAGLIVTALASCEAPPSSDETGGIDSGLGSQDASGDVTLGSCDKGSFGVVTCTLDIVNSSDGTSDYYVEAEINDAAGANIGMANAFVTHVAGGQAAHADLTGTFTGEMATITIHQVQRTAS